jgi:hypothetical protein
MLVPLTIDYSVFYREKYDFGNLYKKIGNLSEKLKILDKSDSHSKGITFCIPSEIFILFKREKFSLLNTNKFIDNLYGCIIFLTKGKLVETDILFYNDDSALKILIDSFNGLMGKNIVLYYRLHDSFKISKKNIMVLSKLGFNNFDSISPITKREGIFLIRKNRNLPWKNRDFNVIWGKLSLYQKLKSSNFCYFYIRISEKSKNILKEMVESGGARIEKNGKISQKEISGCFYIADCKGGPDCKEGKIPTFKFSLNKNQIKYNKDEDAEIAPCKYNFHTHPFSAYINNDTKYAWPSCSDYKAFLISFYNYGTFFHILASLEGIYIISINKDWINSQNLLDNDTVKYIESKYDLIKERNIYTPNKYIKIVNNYSYKGKEAIFKVFFSSYEKREKNEKYKIYFYRKNGQCVI